VYCFFLVFANFGRFYSLKGVFRGFLAIKYRIIGFLGDVLDMAKKQNKYLMPVAL
jgi:hypothetical protein